MANYFITFPCSHCEIETTANPDKVPCLIKDGERYPICQTCADIWNRIHRVDKGLEPVDYGDAYIFPGSDYVC